MTTTLDLILITGISWNVTGCEQCNSTSRISLCGRGCYVLFLWVSPTPAGESPSFVHTLMMCTVQLSLRMSVWCILSPFHSCNTSPHFPTTIQCGCDHKTVLYLLYLCGRNMLPPTLPQLLLHKLLQTHRQYKSDGHLCNHFYTHLALHHHTPWGNVVVQWNCSFCLEAG